MKIEIISDGFVVGDGDLINLDPPMGIAFGSFVPSDRYDRKLHAGLIDGEVVEGKRDSLFVRASGRATFEFEEVVIHDMADSTGEIEVTVFGIPYPQFEDYFAHNPQYQAYWSNGA